MYYEIYSEGYQNLKYNYIQTPSTRSRTPADPFAYNIKIFSSFPNLI